jgi:hypothetical protein
MSSSIVSGSGESASHTGPLRRLNRREGLSWYASSPAPSASLSSRVIASPLSRFQLASNPLCALVRL